MALSTSEASLILGRPETDIRAMQRKGLIPNPIPDDFFDPFVDFRLRLEVAMRRRVDAERSANAEHRSSDD